MLIKVRYKNETYVDIPIEEVEKIEIVKTSYGNIHMRDKKVYMVDVAEARRVIEEIKRREQNGEPPTT